ncbi:MAG: hypothetical protein KC416_09600 [Myxococcales bacterium]|nr:hypothetical protein [Myxococcales bacterium]
MWIRNTRILIAIGGLVLAGGCGGDEVVVQKRQGLGGGSGGGAVAAKSGPKAGEVATADAEDDDADQSAMQYRDEAFVESESNRDPFRSYMDIFKVKATSTQLRAIIMPDTSVDQMRLIAIISGVARARAMLIDSSGMGQTVERGDYIGRPEVVRTGGAEGMPVSLNWRVDRIRPEEVVLSREDPTSPNQPPLTRVIPLHDDR